MCDQIKCRKWMSMCSTNNEMSPKVRTLDNGQESTNEEITCVWLDGRRFGLKSKSVAAAVTKTRWKTDRKSSNHGRDRSSVTLAKVPNSNSNWCKETASNYLVRRGKMHKHNQIWARPVEPGTKYMRLKNVTRAGRPPKSRQCEMRQKFWPSLTRKPNAISVQVVWWTTKACVGR